MYIYVQMNKNGSLILLNTKKKKFSPMGFESDNLKYPQK